MKTKGGFYGWMFGTSETDKVVEDGDDNGHKHPDGSPCHASCMENCPFFKKDKKESEEIDDVSTSSSNEEDKDWKDKLSKEQREDYDSIVSGNKELDDVASTIVKAAVKADPKNGASTAMRIMSDEARDIDYNGFKMTKLMLGDSVYTGSRYYANRTDSSEHKNKHIYEAICEALKKKNYCKAD